MAFIKLLLKRMLMQLLSNRTHDAESAVVAHDDAELLPKRISSMQLLRNCTPVAESASMEHAVCRTSLMLKIAAHANEPDIKFPSLKRQRTREAVFAARAKERESELLSSL